MPVVPDGSDQPVPTRYGLSYGVPSADGGWRASTTMVAGWTDRDGLIVGFGAASDYGYGYCRGSDSDALARVGVTGRNGVTLDAAARAVAGSAGRIFADDAGTAPGVELRGPIETTVRSGPAVRYTAVVTKIPDPGPCASDIAHLELAGISLEQSGGNLDSAVERIGPRWDGRAAVAFEEWAGKQSTALKWEGPVGRVLPDCLTEIADAIRDGVRSACEKLRDFIASFVDFRSAKQWVERKLEPITSRMEVAELTLSPAYEWKWSPGERAEPDASPRRGPQQGVVGPSDWPDDLDDYPTSRSWLV